MLFGFFLNETEIYKTSLVLRQENEHNQKILHIN